MLSFDAGVALLVRDRSGDNGANSKALVSELEVQVAKLTVEAAELQRFAQDYMVKASSEKLKVRTPSAL